jgi:hypothetical protein
MIILINKRELIMTVSKVNDRFYRKFLIDHLDNKFTDEDMYDVVASLNPANNKYKIQTESQKISSTSHQVEMKIVYKFRTEKAALLFKTTYENLVQKGKSLLEVQSKGKNVLLKMKEPVLVDHKIKVITSEKQQEKITNAVGFREESQLISDVFLRTVDKLFSSGMYKLGDNKENRLQKRQISNSMALKDQENKLNKNKTESFYSLYKRTMFANANPSNPRINNEVVKEVSKAMDDRVNRLNGALLISGLFRDFSSRSLSNVLNIESVRVKELLSEAKIIDQEIVNTPSFLRTKMQQLSELFKTEEVVSSPIKKKVMQLKYK